MELIVECAHTLPSAYARHAYVADLTASMEALRESRIRDLESVRRRDVNAWRDALRDEDFAGPPVRRRLAAVGSMFGYLVRHGGLDGNAVADVLRPAERR